MSNDAAGGWKAKSCSFDVLLLRKNLVLLYEIGRLNQNNLGACDDVLCKLEANDAPSLNAKKKSEH